MVTLHEGEAPGAVLDNIEALRSSVQKRFSLEVVNHGCTYAKLIVGTIPLLKLMTPTQSHAFFPRCDQKILSKAFIKIFINHISSFSGPFLAQTYCILVRKAQEMTKISLGILNTPLAPKAPKF